MIKVNGRNQASKSTTDLEAFLCPFLSGSNFPNKQSMVQYFRSCHQGICCKLSFGMSDFDKYMLELEENAKK